MTQFDIDSPIVDAGVEALFGQHPERGGQERRQAVFSVLQAAQSFLEGQGAPQGQMYFDHGPDSFLGEVIGICRPIGIHIDIDACGARPPERKVRIEFLADNNNLSRTMHKIEYGRSYGEALHKIREQIREEFGR